VVTATEAGVAPGDRAFHVEVHGIDHIPESERWATPRHLFWMWAGASFQIEYFVYGVILMAFFGLSFVQAVVLIVVGNASFLLLGLTSLQGPDAGTTAMTITRASYGPNGARVPTLFNWLTQVGFETEGLVLVVYAAEVLARKAGFAPGTPAKVAFILLAVLAQLTLPLLGHATIVRTLRALTVPFVVLFAILAGLTLGKAHTGVVAHGADWRGLSVGLAFTIALAGLGWTENGNDYSRYLPRRASKPAIVGWVFLGTALPEILVMTLGAAVGTYASAIATGENPFAAFLSPHVVATGFVVPLLVVAILQLFAINSLDLYSSGVTLQTLGLRVRRWQAVLVDTVIACGLTVYAVFDSSFSTLLKDFADCVICWIAPWMAIFLVDWALRRFRYAPSELQRLDPGGLYYRRGGVHWPAIVAQALGTFGAVEALSQTFFVGQISRWVGADRAGVFPDFSIYIGVAVAAVAYLVLAWRRLSVEARRQEELAPSPEGLSAQLTGAGT
jgi:NCS1 family nucleobase:cation symporter-1